jgi:hypothetical protein
MNLTPRAGVTSSQQTETGISIPKHDYIALTYNSNNDPTAVTYRIGGPSGSIVATLSLGYDASFNLTSVQRIS